jgi:serine/threonine protein phosphatase PrpC
MLRDERLEQLLSEGISEENDAQKLARSLIDVANLAGGEGNVSAIVIGIL